MGYEPGSNDYEFVDGGSNPEDEELGYDTHVPMVTTGFDGSTGETHIAKSGLLESDGSPQPSQPRGVRTRPMPERLARKYPDVRTIVLIKNDGQVIALTRKGKS